MCDCNLRGDRILCKQRDQIPPPNGRDEPTFSDATLIEGDGYTPNRELYQHVTQLHEDCWGYKQGVYCLLMELATDRMIAEAVLVGSLGIFLRSTCHQRYRRQPVTALVQIHTIYDRFA